MDRPNRAADRPGASVHHDALHDELHRRIEELRAHHEDDFGRFHRLDWLLIVLGFVLLPLGLYLWFLP